MGGLNVIGYLATESGVGEVARRYVQALRSLQIPLALNNISSLQGNRSEDRALGLFDESLPHDINLICADVELHYAIMSHFDHALFEDRFNIGLWAWELPRFPEKWHDRFAFYDEVWVGTSFIAKSLAPISPIPVVCVPPVLTAAPGSRESGRSMLGVSDDELVYLFVFDFNSHLQRKNPLGLIDAFKMAFTPSESARLVIKCVNAASNPSGFAAMTDRAQGHRIAIHAGYWPSEAMRDLMAASDVYVSLHRSEGIGLTITDAMALGKPVIATGWSGNMDFMSVFNSFPVRYELVELEKNVGPYQAGQFWAEPSVDHAAELMRLVFRDRSEAEARAQAAKSEIGENYCDQAVAHLIQQRLAAIAMRHRLPKIREEIMAQLARYRQLPARIGGVVDRVLPRDATVMVVSKGDRQLLQLGGRTGWHFPQQENGVYAGYYPADSTEAIAHLEALRAKGADYLLFPVTAFWWLDHYTDLRRHLETNYRHIRSDEHCTIFQLSPSPGLSPDRVSSGEGR